MFYSQFILAKKGPLGTIWIAAHLERKLRKNQVAETDIGVTVDNILFPEVPIALRLSGHLLLGVVRIYSRQVNYLFNDCSETLGKIKQAFHSAAVDLPPEATTAPFHSITLPETFDFDELELGPDSESAFLYSKGKYVDHHVTTREQITLQDSIQNNPYFGSSQFGLDERFGDGSYSSLGLDFDEEFWASKAGSSSIASTSTPLLKEDTVVLPAGGESEVKHMDVEDPYNQPLESDIQRSMPIRQAVDSMARQIEMDDQPNMSIPASSLVPFNEPSGFETALRKDSDFAAVKSDSSRFHAYTPRVLEACTPDLNREYCPPDEPSTPALAEETTLPMYKECAAKIAGNFLPATLGITEKSYSGQPLAFSSPQQISGVNMLASSSQAAGSPSVASFQGFSLQQVALAGTNREAFLTQKEKGPVVGFEENAASVSVSFQSVPQTTVMHQISTPVSQEAAVFPAGTSSFSTIPESSFSSLRQRDGNLSITTNHQLVEPVHEELYPRFQNEGLAVGSQNPVSSTSAVVELAGAVTQVVDERVQQQGLVVGSQNLVSPFGATFGSDGGVNCGIYGHSPQQGLAGSQNWMSSLGAVGGLAGTPNQKMYPSFQQQGLTVGSQIPVSSLPSFGAMAGVAGTLDQGGHASSQQQGLAIGSSNPVFSVGAVDGSVGALSQRSYPSYQHQGLSVASPNLVSSLPSSGVAASTKTVDHGVCESSQQQGIAVASPNLVSSLPSLGVIRSAGSADHGVRASSHSQGLAFASPNPVSALPSSGAIGSAGSVDHGVPVSSQQPGLKVGSPNPMSSYGTMAGSAGTGKQVSQPSFQQQGLAVASPNPVFPLASVMIGPAGTLDHEVHASAQRQGLAAGSLNPVSSFGIMTGSAGAGSQGTHPSLPQQGLAVASPNPVSSLSSAMAAPAGTADHEVYVSPPRQEPGSLNPTAFFRATSGIGIQGTHPSSQRQGLTIASPNSVASSSLVGPMVEMAGTVDHGVFASSRQKELAGGSLNPMSFASSQQKDLAVGSLNPMSFFGAIGSAGTGSQGTHPSFVQQGLAVAAVTPVSSMSSFGTTVGSAGTVDHGTHVSSQQQGVLTGSPNSVPSLGAMAASAGARSQGARPSFQQLGPAAASPNLVSSSSSFEDVIGSAGTGSHGVHVSSHKQGLPVASPNPLSLFGATAGSDGSGSRVIYPSFQQQGSAVASLNPVSSLSPFGAMVGCAGTLSHGVQASSQQQGSAVGSQNSVSSFGAMVRSTGVVNQEAYPSFHQQGPAVGPQNTASSFGALVESTVSRPPITIQNMGASQVLASPVMTEASNAPLFSANSGSLLPVTNTLPTGHMERMKSNKDIMHQTLDSGAFKGLLQPSVTQQVSLSSPTVRPGISPSMRLGEYETLRSAYDSQSGSPGYLMMQKDISVERIPGLEIERNKSFSVSTGGFTKEATLPAMDKIPLWREETPYSFSKAPILPSQRINSLPADDDVLASILGRRSRDFKVVATPNNPKEPKVSAAKRPKRAPRLTPKKRKIEIDTVAVLHGDVIRQQLANAEDTRRDRRKAPCTRREVWAFIRESEGQEKFDEPTLPEVSLDLHDLYHDVLHGHEARPLSSASNGAAKINQSSESQLIRRGETDSLVLGVNKDANRLGPRSEELSPDLYDLYHDVLHGHEARPLSSASNGALKTNQSLESQLIGRDETDFLVLGVNKDANTLGLISECNYVVDCTNEDFNRDLCIDKFVGHKNNFSESLTRQLNEDAKVAIVQTSACVSSIEVENTENSSAKEFLLPEAGLEGLARNERKEIALPEAQVQHVLNPSGIISREREANEQLKQVFSVDREAEAPVPSQREILASSLSENVAGFTGVDEGIAMTMQTDVRGVVGEIVGTQERAMTMRTDVCGVVGENVGTQERAMTMQKDVLGVVSEDVRIQDRAMTLQKDVLDVVSEEVGTQERAMTMQKDILGIVGEDVVTQERAMAMHKDVLGVMGEDVVTPERAMLMQKDALGVVGEDVGTQERATAMQKDVLGVMGEDVGTQERAMTMQKDVLGIVGEDVVTQERAMAMGKDVLGVMGEGIFTQARDMLMQKDVVGVVGEDVGTQERVMAMQKDVLGVMGEDVGTQERAMTMQKDVLSVMGEDVGTQERAMTMQKDVLSVVGEDAVAQEGAMSMQKDVLGVVSEEGVIQERAMTMHKNVLVVVGEGVATQERSTAMVHDTERLEEKHQFNFGIRECEVTLVGKETDFKPLDVPSDGKDLTEVPMPEGKDGLKVPLQNVVDPDRGILEGRTEVSISDGKDTSKMPLINVVDIDKGNMEGRTEVPMSDGKDAFELPLLNVIDIEKGDMEGMAEVPMPDGKDVSEVPLLNVLDMDKGNMEAGIKLLNTEGIDNLPTANITEEETNRCEDNKDKVAVEYERHTDFPDDHDDANDVAFVEIDYSSDEQDASIQDSNGWSARSRNVGRYLKTAFEEMDGNSKRLEQGPTLALERLLARKTRREAARMFFETLVLKTKDYIHVEQNVAYQDIHLFPRSKLMKTEF